MEHVTNCSFVPLSYNEIGSIVRTLVDKVFEINNTWFGFHNNIKELTNILGKNMFPSRIVHNAVTHYLNNSYRSYRHFHHCQPQRNIEPLLYITYHFLALLLTRFNAKLDVSLSGFAKILTSIWFSPVS